MVMSRRTRAIVLQVDKSNRMSVERSRSSRMSVDSSLRRSSVAPERKTVTALSVDPRGSRMSVDSSVRRSSMSRPERKTVTASTELGAASSSLLLHEQSSSPMTTKTVNGLKALYAAEKKHIWFTAAVVLVFIASFVIFERLYPQAPVIKEDIIAVPLECMTPDANGCFDDSRCIQPDFLDKPSYLEPPACMDSKHKCGYQCVCAETNPTQLTSADFAVARFLFFTPKVPFVQAGLGGALLLFFLATILMRKQRNTTEVQYMAGTGKNDYEEWQLYAFPAKYTFQGVTMMALFLAWTVFQFVAFAWLVVPTLDSSEKFSRLDCVLTQMVDNRFCWTLVFVIPSGVVFLIVGSVLDRFKALMFSHCPVHDATRVELLLVKVTSTKLKGKVVQTSYSSRSVCQLEKHGDLVAFEAFGVRYVYLGESTASPPPPQFMAIGKHVMSGVTMAAIDKYVTLAHAAEKAAASSEAFELPYSKANLSADSAAEQLVRKCQPLSQSKQAISIIGKNYIPIEVPSFPEAWIEELARPFYVFQFLCCVLWTIDNYIPYGYGLMFLLLLGSSQGAYVTIKSKKDMKKLVDKKYDVKVLRRDADNSPAASWASMKHVELLPGDIIKIQAGSPVPADCILVRGSVLMDESMLTGEALPLSKSCPEHMDDKVYTPMMKKCTLYADTLCLKSNDAVAIVGKTGMFTMKGELLQALIMPVQYQPQYQKEANFALFLMFLYSIWNYVIVVFLEFKNSPDAQFKCASFIYGLEAIAMVIPPILPLAVLIGLNMSVARLNKRNIFTFQVNRIGIIGGTKIMCFDKTGTITEDGMRFKNVRPVAADSGAPCFASSDWSREQLVDKPESLLANAMATCHSLEELNQRLVGNQVDMEMFGGVGFQPGSAPKTYTHKGVTLTVVKQFEFIHALQTMAVIVRDTSGAHHAFCKGSYERIKSRLAPSSVPADYDAVCTGLAKAGAYVLAMAGKSLKGVPNVQEMAREELECDLTLLGLLVFLNDVKETSPAAFKSISDGGIDCKIITGDNAFTAVKVARSIAMNQASTQTKFYVGDVVQQHLVFRDYDTDAEVPADKIHECVQKALVHFHDCIDDKCPRPLPFALCVTGAALQLFDNQLRLEEYHLGLSTLNMVPAISIFARVSPAQKAEIVTDIEEAGAVVGMCGDGGNDVNALRQATFGFALSTTDAGIAAPFSTDRKDLTSLVELLIEGRTSLTTNFGAFKFMLTYGLFYSFYNLANNFHGGYFATKQFYYMDFGINLLLTIGVTSSDPSSTLIKGLPPSSIYSLPVQLSIWAPCVISAILLIVLKYWTTNQPWYTATLSSFADGSSFPSDAQIQGLKSRNYLSTVYFHACSWSLIVTGFIYTFGGYFRQPVWRNKVLMISLIALVVVSSIMILLPSKGAKVAILKSDLADPPKLFEVNGFDDAFDLYPLPESFKVELFFLVVGFMAAMAFIEQAIIILCQKIDGKSGWNRFLEQLPGDEREILDEISFYE